MYLPVTERPDKDVSVIVYRLWVVVLVILGLSAQATPDLPPPPSVFDLPRVQAQHAVLRAKVVVLLGRGEHVEAERYSRRALALIPYDAGSHYNLACAQALQGKVDEALASLERAVAFGFRDVDHLNNDEDLASLRDHERFQRLLADAAGAQVGGEARWRYRVTP